LYILPIASTISINSGAVEKVFRLTENESLNLGS